MAASQTWLEALGSARADVSRASTAARVAGVLRQRVIEGQLKPGTRLSEEEICEALGVSRNTLREAFRLLTHERLLEHVFNRGVFVRSMGADDVRELYAFRRVLEGAAVRHACAVGSDLGALRATIDEGRAAARAEDWPGVGTANIHFHQALTGLIGSSRMDETMSHLLAELRLVFHWGGDPRAFHEPYLAMNEHLVDLIEQRDAPQAEQYLLDYFDMAEGLLLRAVAG